jgi:hypothetical protein
MFVRICPYLPFSARAATVGSLFYPSSHETAVKEKEVAGFMVFTEIDHAAAAKKFGLDLRPRTVIVFGNPKLGTPAMVKSPL